MGTQAIISIVKNDNTFIKIICGCNGYNAEKLANIIKEKIPDNIQDIYDLASKNKFGCEDCLVVMDKNCIIYNGQEDFDEEIFPLYRKTFDNPSFNPRWRHGTADYVIILKYDNKRRR